MSVTVAVERPWVAVAPREALGVLEPLAAAHAQHGPTRLLPLDDVNGWRAAVHGARAVLVVGSPDQSPAVALSGPLVDDEERPVPVGWVPSGEGLSESVRAMAEVAARPPSASPVPVVLLAGRDARYEQLLDSVEQGLELAEVYRWDSVRASRYTMLRGLRLGAALALYSGHGTSRGWASYGGITGRDFASDGHPLGALLCLTCHAASRPRTGGSFAEEVVAAGGAAAVLASTGDVSHEEHVAMARSLVTALRAGASTIGELVCQSALPASILRTYCIIGDPAAPLAAAAGAAEACRQVAAPAPGDSIPELPTDWWPRAGSTAPVPAISPTRVEEGAR